MESLTVPREAYASRRVSLHLRNAALCCNCDGVFELSVLRCPNCASEAILSLSGVLDRGETRVLGRAPEGSRRS